MRIIIIAIHNSIQEGHLCVPTWLLRRYLNFLYPFSEFVLWYGIAMGVYYSMIEMHSLLNIILAKILCVIVGTFDVNRLFVSKNHSLLTIFSCGAKEILLHDN